MSGAVFSAVVDQNEYLPDGGRSVDAIIAFTAGGEDLPARGATSATSAAQVIMVDTSGSMSAPGSKLAEAKKATIVAIDTLRDGVPFAIVSGDGVATMAYPPTRTMVPANTQTREAARRAVGRLHASGGTAMSTWLALANELFGQQEAEVKHAILLTDGQNYETHDKLARVLGECEGQFVCDARGVGGDWRATELRQIASKLLGTADALESPQELSAAFEALTAAAMGKAVADVSLRVWTPAGATLRAVKQVYPHVQDLTARRTDVSERIGDYPTGAWGSEQRDYHIAVDVEPDAVGEKVLAARVGLVTGGTVLVERLVIAQWTDDTALSTRINPQVAHYGGQAELAEAIRDGLKARDDGDVDTATAKLGRAVQLATESGHTDTAKLLGRIVDVVDAPAGTVKLKKDVASVDAEMAAVRSDKTLKVKRQDP